MNKDKMILWGSALAIGVLMVIFSFDWRWSAPSPKAGATSAPVVAPAPQGTTEMGGTPTTTPTPDRGNIGNLNATIPDSWQQQTPTSSMRLTQFDIPALGEDTENAQLVVFNRIGGSIDQNLNRWYGQFKQEDGRSSASKTTRETFTANGLAITLVSLKGTYSASMMGMGGAPVDKPGYGMLAAIVSTPEGPYYFKMVGPAHTVDGHQKAFETFLKSMSFVEN